MPLRARMIALLVLAGLVIWALTRETVPTGGPASDQRVGDGDPTGAGPARPIAVAEDGYVTSNRCRACHPASYASWERSWHRTMTQIATPQNVAANLDGTRVYAYGQEYRFERRGDEYWVEMNDPAIPGPEGALHRVERRIALTTGSHHEQDYWYETGRTRKLGFLPLTFRIEEGRWLPIGAAFLQPPTSVAPSPLQVDRWHSACIKCHTTHGKPRTVPGSDTDEMYTTVAEFGVACEACHGPGEEHVLANRDLGRRYRQHLDRDGDPTIANPSRFSPERASQVCGQCHGIWKPREQLPTATRTPDDWREHGFAYRPGDDLEATRYLVRVGRKSEPRMAEILARDATLLEDSFWPDGAIRVSGREYNGLVESACSARGTGERKLSCLSCHQMHRTSDDPRTPEQWANDQLRVGMRGNAACLGCHERFGNDQALVSHAHHPPDSIGSACQNCHMPYTTWGLLTAMRSHVIGIPSVLESREIDRPNACNLCHLDRSMAWTGRWLGEWYGTPLVQMSTVMGSVPASIIWSLSGDAGQRALIAWSMGWEPAMETSNVDTGWTLPLLGQLLLDPYDAVRITAGRSLQKQPGVAELEYDAMAPADERRGVADRVQTLWKQRLLAMGPSADPRSLIDDPNRQLPPNLFELLRRQRNDRVVALRE